MVQLSFAFSLLAGVFSTATALSLQFGRLLPVKYDLQRRQFTIPPITNQQLLAGYNATCSNVNSAEGNMNIQADIANLTATSVSIQTEFQSIGAQLSLIDGENLDGSTKFSPQWSVLTQQWANILWASRDTATDTATTLEEFTNVIMLNVVELANAGESSTAIELLQAFQTEVETLKANAQTTANNFASLQQSLDDFSLLFTGFANATQTADNNMIIKLNAQITNLQAAIKQLNVEMIGLASALGVTPFATAGIALAFPEFAPFIILGGALAAIGEAAALGVIVTDISNDQSNINNLNQQINALQAQLKSIALAQGTISVINTTIPHMVDQLNGFNNIWAAVDSDCESSIQFLNQSTSSTDPIIQPLIFWSTVEQVPCLYQKMVPNLQDYAIGIENSGIPQPTSNVAGFTPLATFDASQLHAKVQSMVQQSQASVAH